jgi:F0F1-type ATP synthase membrane subunit b/b'
MTLQKRARLLTAALASSLILGLAACGEDDVERNVEEGAKEAREAGRDAKKAGEDAAKEARKAGEEAKKAGKDAAREAEKGANEVQREIEE